ALGSFTRYNTVCMCSPLVSLISCQSLHMCICYYICVCVCERESHVCVYVCVCPSGSLATACRDPGIPMNGSRNGEGREPGDSVTFSCDPGYELQGESKITCIQEENRYYWQPSPPSCIAPCGGNVTGSSGFILSPNYPHPYPHSKDCDWLIAIGALFSIEPNYDFLYIYDGPDSSAHLIGSFQDSKLPEKIESTSNFMYLAFRSDGSVSYAGFHLEYKAKLREACFDPGNVMNGTRLGADYKLGSMVTFHCEAGYLLQGHSTLTCVMGNSKRPEWDRAKPTCQAPCGGHFTGSEGTVLSPNYPHNYTSAQSCVYDIFVPGDFGERRKLYLLKNEVQLFVTFVFVCLISLLYLRNLNVMFTSKYRLLLILLHHFYLLCNAFVHFLYSFAIHCNFVNVLFSKKIKKHS
uniref:CUB and Sushi multiple domains 3 n=1 Tax=Nothobranchius furzeri TaxID=105023 RepID=A0A8C6NQD4_NOTFU